MTKGNKKSFTLRAGVSKSDITNDAKDVVVHDSLYAKALVLDDGEIQLVIITMDIVAIDSFYGVQKSFLPQLRRQIEKELNISSGQILVSATHTHPPGRLICSDAELLDRTFGAVRRAATNLLPVKVGAGIGREERISINRTLKLKSGREWSIRQSIPCPPDEDVAELGPVDPEIGILRFDRLDGTPLAIIFNFACHPLIGVPEGAITASYPGFACSVIEEQLGHGVTALFLQGAGGDVTEVLYKDVHRPRDSRPIGEMLGSTTLRTLRDISTGDAALNIISETVEFPRRTDILGCIIALQQQQAELLKGLRFMSLNFKTFLPLYLQYALNPEFPLDYSYGYLHAKSIGSDALAALDAENWQHIETYLKNIHSMEILSKIQDDIETLKKHQVINDQAGSPVITAEIMGIKIGDCALISAPMEMLVEVGLNVKKASPHKHTFIAAFSNGYMYYGPPAHAYGQGGYEVTECFLASEWQNIYEAKANDILQRL